MGYCDPPPRGAIGGEMRGEDLLPRRNDRDRPGPPGVHVDQEADGRIAFGQHDHGESGVRCLVCRAAVSGWLRVYTG